MQGAFFMPILGGKNMLDVIVKLIKNGVVVNKNGESGTGGETAALGSAVLGKMVLGKE